MHHLAHSISTNLNSWFVLKSPNNTFHLDLGRYALQYSPAQATAALGPFSLAQARQHKATLEAATRGSNIPHVLNPYLRDAIQRARTAHSIILDR